MGMIQFFIFLLLLSFVFPTLALIIFLGWLGFWVWAFGYAIIKSSSPGTSESKAHQEVSR